MCITVPARRRQYDAMTWFKVDDSFYDHPKVFDAPDCAVALWVRAGTWSARNLTEGFVPAGLPARLCDDHDTAVKELVRRGLWSRTQGGYRFHDWTKYQPSKAEVEDLRAKRAAAGRLGGLAKGNKQKAGKSQASASGGAKQNGTPTRPDPPPTGGRGVGGGDALPHELPHDYVDDGQGCCETCGTLPTNSARHPRAV